MQRLACALIGSALMVITALVALLRVAPGVAQGREREVERLGAADARFQQGLHRLLQRIDERAKARRVGRGPGGVARIPRQAEALVESVTW